MLKYIYIVAFFLFSMQGYGQCDTLMVSTSNYTLVKTSSKNGSNGGQLTFDNKNNTRWRTSGNGPHEIVFDFGVAENITGFSSLSRWQGVGRISDYKLYVSNDNIIWGDGEKFDAPKYSYNKQEDSAYFGAVKARYVKLILESTSGDLQISEFRFYKDTCALSGKKNQAIDFPAISKKTTTDSAFLLNASTASGAAITYSVVSGPATVSGSKLTLTKNAGIVVVKASVAGSATHYAADREIQFTVIDLATYNPIVNSRLIDDFPLEIQDTNMWYPIYITARIDEPSFLSVSNVKVEIDGVEYFTTAKKGFYYFAWKPQEYKIHEVKIIATGSNGNQTILTKNVEVVKGANTQTVTSMDKVVIQYGSTNSRDYYGKHKLPQFAGTYDKIVANFKVECPNNNCDDWDRYATIEITAPDGNRIQIIRYITPYDVACNHSIDLTEFASLLQGEIEFHVFIDTWGTGGWMLTLDLEYVKGTPKYNYSMVNEIWDGNYDFGNPSNLQPVPEITHQTLENTESSKLILSTTGHGWGGNNTGNAAEFYHAKHNVLVGSQIIYVQDLWNNCNPNPDNCTGQRGTWQYDRAGWCPGTIAPPNKINLDSYVSKSSILLKYNFQWSYKDLCHPQNPSCVSGVTCQNCNAGSNPHYYVDGQVISYSNRPLIYGEYKNAASAPEFINPDKSFNIQVFPNPSNGVFQISSSDINGAMSMSVFSVDGVQHRRYFFSSSADLEAYQFNLIDLESGVYFIEISNAEGTGVSRIVLGE